MPHVAGSKNGVGQAAPGTKKRSDDQNLRRSSVHRVRNDRLYYNRTFPHAQVYEPPTTPAISTNTPLSAGTAPESAASSTMQGQGGLHADPPVVSPRELARPALGISFREHAEQAERLAEALSRTINREIERLDNEGRNEPAWQDEIEFLRARIHHA